MFTLDTESYTESLKTALESTFEVLEGNLLKINGKIHKDSVDNTPVDIGTLRENSGVSIKREGNQLISYIGYLEFYSVYVHQGTGIFALEGNGRQTPWWWKGTTAKWAGWHKTHGQKPKQFLWNAYLNNIGLVNPFLAKGLE